MRCWQPPSACRGWMSWCSGSAIPTALPAGHPAREKAEAVDGVAAFVCEGTVCSLPVTEPNRLIEVAANGLV